MTWTEAAPMIAAILSSNPNEQTALEELYRMAKLADLYVEQHLATTSEAAEALRKAERKL